ncbi:MAG: nitroreductase family deazaflavin-dependent oxidoreductase [Chloroflexota bacterium]|nr:nitroreductase family deazaflavin-dependent oxidoreductase [Chloroflexota bacterium]
MLLLTTTGRNSGAKPTTPLIYQRHGDDYLVVAFNGGGNPPVWFVNLAATPGSTGSVGPAEAASGLYGRGPRCRP